MMKRKFYPQSSRDRIGFWLSISMILFSILNSIYRHEILYFPIMLSILLASAIYVLIYFLPDIPPHAESEKYALMISNIKDIGKKLFKLSQFFAQEQKRITDVEATINKLKDEKAEFEPIILLQREIVETILAAHDKRISANVWKERIIGFILGIITSYLATVLYGWLHH